MPGMDRAGCRLIEMLLLTRCCLRSSHAQVKPCECILLNYALDAIEKEMNTAGKEQDF